MAKQRAYHHGDLYRGLVDAALAIIAREGVDRLTLRKAAREAGVSHAAPAHHFGDLRGLLAAIAEDGYIRLHDEVLTAYRTPANADPLERMRRFGLAYVGFAARHPPHFRAMFHPALAEKSDLAGLMGAAARLFELLVEVVTECQQHELVRAGDPRRLALLAWSTVHGLAVLLVDDQLRAKGLGGRPKPLTEQVLTDLFRGLHP